MIIPGILGQNIPYNTSYANRSTMQYIRVPKSVVPVISNDIEIPYSLPERVPPSPDPLCNARNNSKYLYTTRFDNYLCIYITRVIINFHPFLWHHRNILLLYLSFYIFFPFLNEPYIRKPYLQQVSLQIYTSKYQTFYDTNYNQIYHHRYSSIFSKSWEY